MLVQNHKPTRPKTSSRHTCPFRDVNGQLVLLLDVLGMFTGQAPGRGMINVFWYSGSIYREQGKEKTGLTQTYGRARNTR